ncbi:MAG: hypothetical protein ACRDQG_17970 [Pseudonocardiaceae bacterium]
MDEWRSTWIVEGRTTDGWLTTVEVGMTTDGQIAVRAPETALLDADALGQLVSALSEAITQMDEH